MTATRRALLASAAAALALPATARAKGEDKGLLELLVGYSGGVIFAYDQALRHARLSRSDRATLARLLNDAGETDESLRHALVDAGGSPAPRRPASPAPPGSDVTRETYLRYVVRSEELLASGWYAALQKLADTHVLEGAVAFMATGGRRLVEVRHLTGLPLLPRAFEIGAS
jgi:hypothetical protein